MQVTILGSGPAGLLAALACEQMGHEPVIYAKGEKSKMFGAMYLHEPIPGLTGDMLAPDFEIDVIKQGSRDGYAENVYGAPGVPCSWDSIPSGTTPAWNLTMAYDKLWDRYKSMIHVADITIYNIGSILHHSRLAFCSIPAQALCAHPYTHQFKGQEIYVVHGPGTALIKGVNDNHIMYYNGTPPRLGGFDWYRFSQIDSYQAWEYSLHHADGITEEAANLGRQLDTGVKPLSTNCNCWTQYPSMRRIGRFGRWEKGVLTHHSYREAREALHALL